MELFFCNGFCELGCVIRYHIAATVKKTPVANILKLSPYHVAVYDSNAGPKIKPGWEIASTAAMV